MSFLMPSKPAPLPPPPAPTPVPTIEDTAVSAANQSDALRRRQGRASTVLAGKTDDAGTVSTTASKLLGS